MCSGFIVISSTRCVAFRSMAAVRLLLLPAVTEDERDKQRADA